MSHWLPKKVRVVDDMPVCNCAACNVELIGDSVAETTAKRFRSRFKLQIKQVYARMKGRPYCEECFKKGAAK